MTKQIILVILLIYGNANYAQIRRKVRPPKEINLKSDGDITNYLKNSNVDSLFNTDELKVELKVELNKKTTFKNYQIIPHEKDSIYVDTTLTIKKDYKFNYIRKDDFELLPFHNQGQTYNKLGYKFDEVSLYPQLGATAKHYNYYEVNDINYYQVATPFTELMYRKGLEQGQILDALITFNLNNRQNISLAYKGLRSLGKYRNSLSSHGNMRFTYTYQTENHKYQIKTHLTVQDLYNEESGGLQPNSIYNFENAIEDFKDRGQLETYFTDANNMLRGNRYYLNHNYNLLMKNDSISTKYKINIGHIFKYETKHYEFYQNKNNIYFGASFNTNIKDRNHLTILYNQINTKFKSDLLLGQLKLFVDNYKYNYSFKNLIVIDNNKINQSINGSVSSIGASWHSFYKGIAIQTKAATTFSGNLNGNYIKATASYKKDSLFTLRTTLLNNSKAPNYNMLINQSDYLDYNWKNNFKNELTRTLLFEIESDKILNASAQITQLDNYTYLSDTIAGSQPKPLQYSNTVNYLKVKANKTISFRKFTLDNTIMYQKIASGSDVFRVPEFVTRNTLYYANSIFKKKPMYIQTGITFKYFTNYYANSYNPLLSEFNLQNKVKIGNYPVFDVFINARVRSMRLFLKAEHINTLFSKDRNYYSAPNYPYRDYTLRFGIVWNFFI